MEKDKENAIRQIIDRSIKSFVDKFELRYNEDLDNPLGVINSKISERFIT